MGTPFPCADLTSGQDVPGDGVCDRREDPVQLSQGSSPVIQSPRNPRGGEKKQVHFLLKTVFFEIHSPPPWLSQGSQKT